MTPAGIKPPCIKPPGIRPGAAPSDKRSRRRREDERFLRGTGLYVDDTPAQGELHAVFVRSPHAHAALGPIEADIVRAMPGVRAVLTAAELDAAGIRPIPCGMTALASLAPLIVPPRPGLGTGFARYVGEPVALVIAETLAAARDGAEALPVQYQALSAQIDPLQAGDHEAPQVWPQAPGNLAYRFQRGDPAAVQAAFASAAHVAEISLVNNRVAAAAIEPRGAVATDDPARGLHLHLSGQGVAGLAKDLAESLGQPVRVSCPDVGGGFGMKNVVHPEYVALLAAARMLQTPVRWIADRTEEFTSGVHGRDNHTTARLALDAAGRFLALDVATVAPLGAYASALGPGAATNAPSTAMGGLYAIPAVFMDVRGVFTHTVPLDAYRGAGKPEANYIIERLIDVAARQTGRDRVALRQLNLIERFPHTSALGIGIDTGAFHDNLAAVLAAADHAGFPARRAAAAARGRLLGQGIGCFLETSRGAPTERGAVRFRPDGVVELLIGTQSNGQGLDTAFAQVAAAHLGLPESAFEIVQADTALYPHGSGHGGARSLVMAGTALLLAMDAALERARPEAARLLQADPAALRYEQGAFHATDGASIATEGASIALPDLVQALPPGSLDSDALNPNEHFVFPNGAHVAEVEIDPETGAVALCRYVAIDDYGVLVNPLLAEGQVMGGLAQGIGQALCETIHYDATGQLLTAGFADYAIPRASDLPCFEIGFNEHPTARNPLGGKGSGQAGAIGAAHTVMNAIADALDVAHIDMPATPERVWRALHTRKDPA